MRDKRSRSRCLRQAEPGAIWSVMSLEWTSYQVDKDRQSKAEKRERDREGETETERDKRRQRPVGEGEVNMPKRPELTGMF